MTMELDEAFVRVWDLVRVECPKLPKSLTFSLAKLKYQMENITKEERIRRQNMLDEYQKSLAASEQQMKERDPVKKMTVTIERFEKEWAFFVGCVQKGELIGDEKREAFVDLVMDVLELRDTRVDPVLARHVIEKNFKDYSFPIVRKAVVSLLKSGDTRSEATKYFGARCRMVAQQTKGDK